ncbi:MAG: efflux RND transporter periplasmic adaptor subunit [Gemmatimonadales bacterium]
MIRIHHTRRTLTLLALSLGAAACGKGGTPGAPAAGAGGSRPKAPVAGDMAFVEQKALDAVQHLQGELTPFEAVDVFARVNGYVREIPVDRGAVVHGGDVLARLDAPELQQQRAEAQARLVSSRQTAERLRVAARTLGAVSVHELELADAAMRADSARAEALKDMEGYLVVRAPFDGVVTDRRVHPGALVGPSQGGGGPLVRLEDHARLRLTIAVPEQLAGVAPVGREIGFTVSAFPGQAFHGRVARVAGSVDARTRTMPVELDVMAEGKLAPGMYGDVAWPVSRRTPSLFVPAGAIVQTTARTYVIRVHGGAAQLVNVTRGVASADLAEVFGALAKGDTLLRRGVEDVADGDPVVLRPPAVSKP